MDTHPVVFWLSRGTLFGLAVGAMAFAMTVGGLVRALPLELATIGG